MADSTGMLSSGANAPDFSLPDVNGRVHSLAEALQQGPVLLVIFKIACPTSQYTLPFVDRLHRQLQGAAVTVWAISQDTPEHTAMFNKEFEVSLPELFDSEDKLYPVSDAYGVTHAPSIFLVEQDGAISRTSVGFNKLEIEEIAERLAVVADRPGLTAFEADEEVPLVQPGCASKN